MPPFDQIKAILLAWYQWHRARRIAAETQPIRARLMEVEVELAAARRLHRPVRDLERQRRRLKNLQLNKELGL